MVLTQGQRIGNFRVIKFFKTYFKMNSFNILTLNFSRISNIKKILEIWAKLEQYNLDVLCIQEVNVDSVIKCFSDKFKVFVNWDLKTKT